MNQHSSARAIAGLRKEFGQNTRWLASAPGRVNLIGEFTDFNGGFVLPMAIDRRTAIAAAPNDSGRIVIRSEACNQIVEITLNEPIVPELNGHWGNYPKGVIAEFLGAGLTSGGFDAFVSSDVPIGAGLSSSAALETATATLFEGICGVRIDPLQKALMCQAAEHAFPQVPCGIMDQYISVMAKEGHVLLLDCSSKEPAWIALEDPSVAFLVVNTNIKHQLAGSEYAGRRRHCEIAAAALDAPMLCHSSIGRLAEATDLDEMTLRCARHVLTENERTLESAACIRVGDWERMGRLMYASHESLRRDYQVSCLELDTVVEIAKAIGLRGGIYGCRMTGGGFGGCAVALVRSESYCGIARQLSTGYRVEIGKAPDVFLSRPVGGASLSLVN